VRGGRGVITAIAIAIAIKTRRHGLTVIHTCSISVITHKLRSLRSLNKFKKFQRGAWNVPFVPISGVASQFLS
jgi:hypothetical protein